MDEWKPLAHGRLPLEVLDVECGPTAPAARSSSHRDQAAAAAEGAAAGGALPLGPAPIPTSVAPGRPHRVLGGTDEFKTCGWVFSREDVFMRHKLTQFFDALASEPAVKRFKGVVRVGPARYCHPHHPTHCILSLHFLSYPAILSVTWRATSAGHYMRVGAEWVMPKIVELEGGARAIRLEPIAYRRDSRLEVIVMPGLTGSRSSSCLTHAQAAEANVSRDNVIETEAEESDAVCAAAAARRCDWDALEVAIKGAVKPPRTPEK